MKTNTFLYTWGSGLTLFIILIFYSTGFSQRFRAAGPKILNPYDNKPLVMRGVNIMAADWDNFGRHASPGTHSQLKMAPGFLNSYRVNTVRIQWRAVNNDYTSRSAINMHHNPKILGQYIAEFAKLGITSVIQLHDYTGASASSKKINTAAVWWYNRWAIIEREFRRVYYAGSGIAANRQRKLESFVILNIANEYTNGSDTEQSWFNAYTSPQNFGPTLRNLSVLQLLRKVYSGIIIIDGLNYAQNPNSVYFANSRIGARDRNVGFGIHTWDSWARSGTSSDGVKAEYSIAGHIAAFAKSTQPYPVIIGEFGQELRNSAGIDYVGLMAHSARTDGGRTKIGWLAWALWGDSDNKKWYSSNASTGYNNDYGGNRMLYTDVKNTPGSNSPAQNDDSPMWTKLTVFGRAIFPSTSISTSIYDVQPKALPNKRWFVESTPELSLTTPAPKLEVTVGDLSAKLFPNPTGGAFNLEFNSPEEDNIEVAVYDLKGSRLKEYKHGIVTGENRLELMAPDQPGVYVVQALTGKGKRFASTLVVSE